MSVIFGSRVTEANSVKGPNPGAPKKTSPWCATKRSIACFNPYDIVKVALIATVAVIALWTVKDYAISNDEGVQHHYGELILAYYESGFRDQSVFTFQNLYLYGGLFDIIAVTLVHLIPIDPYDLRHILCALVGVGGIAATAATARSIAGPRAGLVAAVALCVCGAWYGTMFNHTKDIPFAAAMMAATLFLVRIGRRLPLPRISDLAAFGLLLGAALGMRILGLLMIMYVGFAITLYLPQAGPGNDATRWQFVIGSVVRMLPAMIIAYVVMILTWPWAALAPFNPIRGLLAFSEFHYSIRTAFVGHVYDMADVPRLYVPIYVLIRVPVLTLFGAAIALISTLWPCRTTGSTQRRDIVLVMMTVITPLACQMVDRGPAFTGLRHFLFIIPPLATLAGIGLDRALIILAIRGRIFASGGLAFVTACFFWNAVTLIRLHPYENLFYNSLVGGLEGASRRYDLDYWFNSMPEAINKLEAYLRSTTPTDPMWRAQVYSVAVCGDRLAFEKTVTLPQLKWDFMPTWSQSDFFIAPTQMNCDGDVDGAVVASVERLGVAIAYVKDRRSLTRPLAKAVR
jgi:hypothetical protein